MQTIPDVHPFVSPARVGDHPVPDRCMICGQSRYAHYFRAVDEENDLVSEALAHIRVREDKHEITTAEAATERVGLLTEHLERLHLLRVKHLGGTP